MRFFRGGSMELGIGDVGKLGLYLLHLELI